MDKETKQIITVELELIKSIIRDIKNDKDWVNDSESRAEYRGICDGLDRLVRHIEELCDENNKQT
jgi:hypothetical protein